MQEESAAVMNDHVHHVAHPAKTHLAEHGDERRHAGLVLVRRQQHGQQQDGTDVEHHDAEDDGADRLGHFTLGILHLASGDADQFDAVVGEDDGVQDEDHHEGTLGEHAALVVEQVRHGGVAVAHLGVRDHHEGADGEEDQDGADLEAGRPEFKLAERLDAEQVHGDQQRERGNGGRFDRHVGEEELEVQADCDQFRDPGHAPVDEVHPAGNEGALLAEHFARVADEGARGLAVHDELAQRPHQQVRDDAGDGVGEDQRRAGRGQTSAGSHEEADADGAAHGNHGDVAAAQGLLVALGAEGRVDGGGLLRRALEFCGGK
ncbi:hypothetical protein ACVWZ8_002284 [Arthrobacter sp. UYCu723]